MGQLERYGLYVLCMVIVLILGVAIWGGEPASAGGIQPVQDDLDRALATGTEPGRVGPPAAPNRGPGAPSATERSRAGFFAPVEPEVTGPDGLDLGGVAPVDDLMLEPAPGAGKPADAAKPVHALRTYTVRSGDTMEGIAEKVLGSKKYVAQIRELNPSVDPRRMRPRTVLKLPWVGGESQEGPDLTADQKRWREYEVRKGDSAYKISQRVYGTSRYANKILEANGITDATKLRPKTVLRIPPLK